VVDESLGETLRGLSRDEAAILAEALDHVIANLSTPGPQPATDCSELPRRLELRHPLR
jgi:hypothetical protein